VSTAHNLLKNVHYTPRVYKYRVGILRTQYNIIICWSLFSSSCRGKLLEKTKLRIQNI